jgi:YjjG family noncanonical pyrimidine nucleotidase
MYYSTFLLDLDHTLFDSDTSEHAAFTQTLRASGIAQPDRYRDSYRRINLELWACVERGELEAHHVRGLRFERLVAEHDLDADPQRMADDFVAGLSANGELYAGALEVLEALSACARLALVTNGLGEVQRARIERVGIGGYFRAIVVSAEVGVAKPAPGIFDITFAALDSPARHTALMVGDNLASDIRGGRNYGISTCWYNPRGTPPGNTGDADHTIGDLRELLRFVAD